jgi:hypothetical protein
MIAAYIFGALSCVLVLLWVHAIDTRDPRMPTRRQLRAWRKERLTWRK